MIGLAYGDKTVKGTVKTSDTFFFINFNSIYIETHLVGRQIYLEETVQSMTDVRMTHKLHRRSRDCTLQGNDLMYLETREVRDACPADQVGDRLARVLDGPHQLLHFLKKKKCHVEGYAGDGGVRGM